MLHAVIMAGGGGSRFWPRSRQSKPKQFLTLAGDQSLLQQAFARVPIPENARSAKGTDANMAVYDTTSDTLWEFWHMRRQRGRWHADFGGRMEGVKEHPGFYRERRDERGQLVERAHWGTTAAKASLVNGEDDQAIWDLVNYVRNLPYELEPLPDEKEIEGAHRARAN